MSDAPPTTFDLNEVTIRLAEDRDHDTVRFLFEKSILEGQLRDGDTGADIENLREGYFADDGASAFWVACHDDKLVGMIGVQCTRENEAEVRRLRVRDGYRRCGIGTRLMEQATDFCQRHGYLKVVLDVRVERGPAISLFEKFGFKHGRTREIGERKTLEFYIDLYRDPR
ncbi:MAG: GNAT family N-acetyltransferase [Planctomycetes bacterium]|nr:GNAT family N-acetyltransferase [Planctomycetota bacterium]